MVWCLHIPIKDMHGAFEMYPCYPKKNGGLLPQNAVRLSIYCKVKLAAILKLSYPPKMKVVYTCLRGNKTLQCIIVSQ